jgi:RNA polymerase sigma-70 factor, ECF subfamily
MDDLQAIRRLKDGDIGGLEILIARHQAKAVRTAYLITQHEPMAEDVVQDTFVRFYERIRHFDESRLFEPYFLCSVVNAALNAVEREKRVVGLTEDVNTTAF